MRRTALIVSAALVAPALVAPSLVALAGAAQAQTTQVQRGDSEARVMQILKTTPLIDGHNDLPWALRQQYGTTSMRWT